MKDGERILGVGIDIIEIERVDRALKRWGDRFSGRVFTEGERAYAGRSARPAQHLSARFAGKEAVAKALGTGFREDCRMNEIEIVTDSLGKPRVELHGGTRRMADRRGIGEVLVSLSHSRTTAVAQAVAVGAVREEED
jgi:holo-[acyl-carrier protein] synthase